MIVKAQRVPLVGLRGVAEDVAGVVDVAVAFVVEEGVAGGCSNDEGVVRSDDGEWC